MLRSVHDPLALLVPLTLKGKHILQTICKLKYGWDQILPETILQSWKQWLVEIDKLSILQIQRCTKPFHFDPIKFLQLHHLCDASEVGYDRN